MGGEVKGDAIKWYVEDEKVKEVLRNERFELRRGYKVVNAEGGEKIFVKFFREGGLIGYLRNLFFPRAKKEFKVFKKLKKLGIDTPTFFGYGITNFGSFSVLQYLPGETYLDVFRASENRIPLLRRLADFLKNLKFKGIRHNDLHLNNLMLIGDRLVLVDLHKISVKKGLKRKDEISNLSHALNMIYDEMSEKEKENFFFFYGSPDVRSSLEKKLETLRARWIKKKMKRAMNRSSIVLRTKDKIALRGFEDIGEGQFVRTLKMDRKVQILKYTNCLKKIYKSPLRLKKAWVNSVVLEYLRLPIAPRVFSMRPPHLFSHGYILMEDLGSFGGMEMDRFLDGPYKNLPLKERIAFIKAFSNFFLKMVKNGIAHRDLKGCNIYVTEGMSFFLLDVEDIVFKKVKVEDTVRMLVKLNTTIPKAVSVTDRLRALASIKAYSKKERKEILKRVVEGSRKEEIVYEGIGGLRIEQWAK